MPTNTPRGQSLVHQSESSVIPTASPLPSTVIPQHEVKKKEGTSPALKGCLIVGAVIFVLAVISSSTESTPETPKDLLSPKDLLKHSIHKEDVYEAPIKTQVELVVLIENKEMDEQKIKDLLNHLYDKTIKRSGFKHHDHPTNIFIYAYTSKDKAESGRGQWVGMISKSYSDKNPRIDISDTQLNALAEVAGNRWGLTQKQRQEVWDKIIRLEDKAQNEANKIHPLDRPGFTLDHVRKNGALMNELKEKYENELAKEYGVGKAIIDSVGLEGLKKGWAFPR